MAAFRALNEKPKWVLAFNLLVLFTVIYSLIHVQFVFLPNRAQIYERSNFTPEQIEDAEDRLRGVSLYVLNILAPFVYVVINVAVVGLFFYLFLPVLRHDVSVRKTYAVVTHSALARIPGFSVRLLLMIIGKTPAVSTGVLALFPGLEEQGFWYRFGSRFDFFTLWEVLLLGSGLGVIAGWRRRYTVSITVGSWIALNAVYALVRLVQR
jgi:hypothetical protein